MPNPRSRRLRRRWLPQAVAVLLAVTQIQAAEQAAVPPQAATAAPQANPLPAQPSPAPVVPSQLPVEQSLTILTLAGNGEMNDLERRVMAPLVVQVLDRNERAVDGATVVFRFPLNGPSATFPDGKTTVTVRTNSGGQAAAVNWMANGQVGTFQIHVNATYGNQVGETVVSMSNVTRVEQSGKNVSSLATTTGAKHESLWSHTWFKIAVIGGVAAAVGLGVYFGTRGGGAKSSTPTVTISPGGSPTITGAQ